MRDIRIGGTSANLKGITWMILPFSIRIIAAGKFISEKSLGTRNKPRLNKRFVDDLVEGFIIRLGMLSIVY